MRLSYPHEKRLALVQYETDSIRLFIISIPSKLLQTVLKRLPAVNGFRPGKDTQRKLSSYLGRIHHWSEKDWIILVQFWFEWTKTCTEIFSALNCSTMEEFERVIVDMSTDENVTREYIGKLANAEYRYSISQQQLEEWFRFGPFSPDQAVFSLIQKAPSEEQLKLYAKVESLSELVNSRFVGIDGATEQLATTTNLNDETCMEFREMMNSSKQTELSITHIAERVSQLESILPETNVIQRDEPQSIIDVEERLLLLKQEMSQIRTMLQGINEKLPKYQEDMQKLTDRYMVDESVLAIPNIEGTTTYQQKDSHELTVTQLAFKATETLDIGDNDQWLITRLKGNLNKLGVQLSDAKGIAATVISSLASGQLVTFSGSFSLSVAQCCASTFAGDAIYLVRIPIGVLDPVETERMLASISQLTSNREFPVAVIFEGLNRSSFDVCGNILKQIVAERLLGICMEYDTSLLLFATLANGQSNLHERGFFEMGPVLYTDMLAWKNTISVAYEPAIISKYIWTSLIAPDTDSLDMDEDIFPKWFSSKNGALWHKIVFMSFIFLQRVRLEHTYKLLYFGWVFPLLTNFFPSRVTDFMSEIELDNDLRVLLESMLELVSENENV